MFLYVYRQASSVHFMQSDVGGLSRSICLFPPFLKEISALHTLYYRPTNVIQRCKVGYILTH